MIKNKKNRQLVMSILFVMPAFILLSIFLLYPIYQTIYLSFYKWNGIARAKPIFVGLSNYVKIYNSAQFWRALFNSFLFMTGGFIVLMPLSFLLANIITSNLKGVRFFKVSYYLPVMLPVSAVGLIWVYILQPDWGLLNSLLKIIGLDSWAINWLGEKTINVITVVLVNEWIYAGFNMLIFAAGLVSIPKNVYESARIDGANKFKTLIYITLPLMKESFKVFAVLCVCGSLRTFDLIYSMTGGGPNHYSEVPATLLYVEAFSSKHFGRGNAIGVIILLLSLSLSIGLNKLMKSNE